jgi:superfamily II helicase
VPRDERICQKCSENEIEEEVHFLKESTIFSDL